MFNFDEPFCVSIFCDDIRQEVGGKFSYMGVYYGAMYVPSFPLSLPKFGIATSLWEPRHVALERTEPIEVRVYLPGADESQPTSVAQIGAARDVIASMPQPELPDEPDVPALMLAQAMFVLAPVLIQQPGRIRVRCHYADGAILRGGSLRIEHQPQIPSVTVASVSPPLS